VQLLTNPRVEVGLAIECGKTYHVEFSQWFRRNAGRLYSKNRSQMPPSV
jgi:hypothetical protein